MADPIIGAFNVNAPGPGSRGYAITPSNSTDLTHPARAIWVGGAGDIKIKDLDGNDVTFSNVPVGFFAMGATRVYATGTTATLLVAVQ